MNKEERVFNSLGYSPITAEDLADATGLTVEAVKKEIENLQTEGLRIEVSPDGYYIADTQRAHSEWMMRRHRRENR